MRLLLLVLALPLLMAPWIAPRRPGGAAAQLLFIAVMLAALWQGAGTLDPRDLHDVAQRSSSDAWFVGVSLGALIAGGVLIAAWRDPVQLIAGAPLIAGAWLAATRSMGWPLVVGAAVAAVPLVLAAFPGRRWTAASESASRSDDQVEALLAVVAVVGMLVLPLVGGVLLLLTLAWLGPVRSGRPWPIIATALATALLVTWCWSAVTVAGSPWMSLPRFALEAPVSPAASRFLAALSIGALLLLLRPWPLSRTVPSSWILVTLAVAVHLLITSASPDGMRHWQPLVSTVLVASAVITAWSGRWEQCAVALLAIAATRPGLLALGAALALALVPAAGRYIGDRRVHAGLAGVVLGVAAGQLLRDQVLLAVLLVLALAGVAYRFDRRVAVAPLLPHL
jgi:hypothetical protein